MKIPKEFKLHGQTIKVVLDQDMSHREGNAGVSSYTENRIYIQPDNNGAKVSKTQIDHCFLHELVHHILNAMGEDELRGNEKFVDVFAALLHQYETTKK